MSQPIRCQFLAILAQPSLAYKPNGHSRGTKGVGLPESGIKPEPSKNPKALRQENKSLPKNL